MATRVGRGPGLAALAVGIVVALAVAGIALAILIDDGGPSGPTPTTSLVPATSDLDPAAAADFVAAWERSRTGTYLVEAAHHQERAGVVVADGEQRIAQRPPDRLVAQFGGVDGRLDGRVVGCAPGPADRVICRVGEVAPPYASEVATEVAALRSYVGGSAPLYGVQRETGGSCFALRLARPFTVPPYGEQARFCFDEATGAPVLQEVTRGDVVDRTVASTVRAPTDADLVLPDPDDG